MAAEQKFEVVRSVWVDCLQDCELRALLKDKVEILAYEALEPSGALDIAQGVQKCLAVKKLTKAGCKVNFWMTDHFCQSNNKLDGDLEKNRACGEYMIEVWKTLGMDLSRVEFLSASEEINKRPSEYWSLVRDIAQKNNLKEVMPYAERMGKAEIDDISAAQTFYTCTQCAGIFFLKADIVQLGSNENTVGMIARDYCIQTKRKPKPVILFHKMLPPLLQSQRDMPKNDPNSTIVMEDNATTVDMKIGNAFCPPGIIRGNPCIEYLKYIVFPWFGKFNVTTSGESGGNKMYASLEELIEDYTSGNISSEDLKHALASAINAILQPVRDHFQNDVTAKALFEKVKKYKKTK